MSAATVMLLALVLAAATGPSAPTVIPFRTEVAPRLDPVFGGVATLRQAVDEFLTLHSAMDTVRGDFSVAVHTTIAQLLPPTPRTGKDCPAAAGPHYARALEAGSRFLALGRRLESRYRTIQRGDDLGESLGLTPDYRFRIKRARELYAEVLRDYREMRVAFYDQLGAEMRHAGCSIATPSPAPRASPQVMTEGKEAAPLDPTDPAAWSLEEDPEAAEAKGETATAEPARSKPASDATPVGGGPAIWIEIDNSHCPQASQLIIDGAPVGAIAAERKVAVRTRSGPHQLCVLPVGDKRACGAPGTVRRAYLYEGWTLMVRCDR